MKRAKKKCKIPDTLNGIKILLFIISGLVVFFSICILYVIMFGVSPDTSRLESLQEITLTVTATAIALVSLISTLIGINREQKLKELEEKLLEAQDTLKTLHKNAEISTIYSLDNNAFFGFKIQRLEALYDKEEENSQIAQLLMQAYWDYSELLPNSKECIDLLNKIIFLGQETEKLWAEPSHKCSNEEKYIVYYHIARAYLVLGQYRCTTDSSHAKKMLESAIKHFDLAEPLVRNFVHQSTYYYYKGLTFFWLYKCESDLYGDRNLYIEYLENSINQYKASIGSKFFSVYEFNVYNDLGVSYIHKACLNDNRRLKIMEFELAKENLEKALRIKPRQHLTYVNLGDIEMYKIRGILNVEKNPIRVGKTIFETINNLSKDDLSKILECIRESLNYLERAKEIRPTFINVYYKKVQTLSYFLALVCAIEKRGSADFRKEVVCSFSNTMYPVNAKIGVSNLSECYDAICNLIDEEINQIKINPQNETIGVLYVLRNYYDIRDFFKHDVGYEAERQNEKIRCKSKINAEKWDKLFQGEGEEYTQKIEVNTGERL